MKTMALLMAAWRSADRWANSEHKRTTDAKRMATIEQTIRAEWRAILRGEK